MSSLSTLPKGDSAWLLRKSIQRIMQQVSVLETNIGSSTTGNSSNGQVIFNDNGTLRGDADMTFNTALNRLIVSSLEVSTTATITGDLTVDTNTLKVVAATDSVGVGFVPSAWAGGRKAIQIGSPAQLVSADLTLEIGSNWWHDGTNYKYTAANPAALYSPSNGSHGWYNATAGLVNGTIGWNTLMTLNSTGLGVGVSPSYKLDVSVNSIDGFRLKNTVASSAYSNRFHVSNDTGIGFIGHGPSYVGGTTFGVGANGHAIYCDAAGPLGVGTTTAQSLWLATNGVVRQTIDSSGNVGIGITPKPWRSGARALQLGANGYVSLHEQSNGNANLCFAAYEGSANVFNYTTTGDLPSRYVLVSGTHQWYTAPSGTAGNAITFTQAMTLDASGDLGVGITNPSHRLHALVSSGADRDIFAAQVLSASNGLQVKWNHATTTLRVILANIPTSSAGLDAGTLWNDAGTIKIA